MFNKNKLMGQLYEGGDVTSGPAIPSTVNERPYASLLESLVAYVSPGAASLIARTRNAYIDAKKSAMESNEKGVLPYLWEKYTTPRIGKYADLALEGA